MAEPFSIQTPDKTALAMIANARDLSPAALLKNQQHIASALVTLTAAVEKLEKLIVLLHPEEIDRA